VLADRAGDREYVFEVGRAVFVRRSADGDELEQAVVDAFLRGGRELQAFGFDVGLDQRIEPGLMDRDDPVLEAFDLLRIDIHAEDVIARIGQARARHEAHVAGPEYGYSHNNPEERPDGRKGRNSNERTLPVLPGSL
jgi:hypothetical protein